MHISAGRRVIGLSLLWFVLLSAVLHAQDDQKQSATKENEPPQISDEPKTVDPATLVPKKLASAVTVNFTDASLREVVQWIQKEQKITVLFDNKALSAEGILLGEPVAERLDSAPVYLLLNRLRSLGLAWYVEDDILHITTSPVADGRMSTQPYNVSDLFDAGYKPAGLENTIHKATYGSWDDVEGEGGSMEWLGDVLFVRQTDQMHRQVAGLLTALRKHGRQTFTLDPPQHVLLRQKLNENISVKFLETPLVRAVQELAEQAKADIRLVTSALRESGVRLRKPVSLTLSDHKLGTVLHVLLADLELTWILRDGVLWITSVEQAERYQKTAVYDVRDLCRNQEESTELTAAIQAQTTGPWEESEGEGGTIVFAQTGTMVVRQTESVLREVRELLAAYRKALRASKPRKRDVIDPKEIVTRYYRMHENMAEDLTNMLPRLVQPDSWKSEQKPDAPGSVLKVASGTDLLDAQGRIVHPGTNSGQKSKTHALVVSRAVLIIRQTRAVHKEIAEVIRRVERGDPTDIDGMGMGMGGMGGGGFGGGYLSIR